MDKVLGIELKNIGRCEISHTLYDGKISESPFFVESTAVNIQIDQKTGVSFGILSGFRLQESNHMLLQLLIGSPQSQPSFKPMYVQDQTCTIKYIRFKLPDVDEEENNFMWKCFAIKDDFETLDFNNIELQDGRLYYYTILDFSEYTSYNFASISQVAKPLLINNQVQIKLNFSLDDSIQELRLDLVPLSHLVSDYSQYFVLQMLDQQSISEIFGQRPDLSKIQYLEWILNQQLSVQNQDQVKKKLQLRFDQSFRHTSQYGYANEFLINFEAEQQNMQLLRKQTIYPGRYLSLNTSSAPTQKIGTFMVHTDDPVRFTTVSYDYNAIITTEQGFIHQISCSKVFKLFKNTPTLQIKQLQTTFILFTYLLCTSDSTPALEAARVNYKKMNQRTVLRPFAYANQAVLLQKNSFTHQTSSTLQLRRPLFSIFYGGELFNVVKTQKYLCVQIPMFNGLKMPQSRFPLHKSETVSFPRFIFRFWGEDGQIKKPKQLQVQNGQKQGIECTFWCENTSFVSYKWFERVPNQIFTHQILETNIQKIIANKENNCFCGGNVKNGFKISYKKQKLVFTCSQANNVPILANDIVQLHFQSFLNNNPFQTQCLEDNNEAQIKGSTFSESKYVQNEYTVVNYKEFIENQAGLKINNEQNNFDAAPNYYDAVINNMIQILDELEKNKDTRDEILIYLKDIQRKSRWLNRFDPNQLDYMLRLIEVDKNNSGVMVYIK
ncbi:Conserved_hypothetical protein [Hexamita inflata]|uniref:Uncharacterized protein n=1 Tax=Hexamita inflata TaxID=28002 RepID=A0AA86VQ07_9EUKA|nr:Conserved hypothetical protein [Hexamita inflata]